MPGSIVLLGGYGRLGTLCAQELAETTRPPIVIAGPNVQRAERAALALGSRARGVYLDAADPRTVHEHIDGAALLVTCCPVAPLAALDRALETRTPVVSLTRFHLEERARGQVQERAWDAQVPVVLAAGAAPGLAGVVAESLVRRFESLHRIRIACTGSGDRTQRPLQPPRPGGLRGALPASLTRFAFPAPVGVRLVSPLAAPDLEGFAGLHCVDEVDYLEAQPGALARAVERLIGSKPDASFALVAEAFTSATDDAPAARVTLQADDARRAAAAALGALARAVLAGSVPAGTLLPREALNPGTFLDALAKRGVRVST